MKKWLDEVWIKHVETLNTPTLLIADMFSPHTSEATRQLMAKYDSSLAIIPSGCSSNVQPLHRGLKLMFKVLYFFQYVVSRSYNIYLKLSAN